MYLDVRLTNHFKSLKKVWTRKYGVVEQRSKERYYFVHLIYTMWDIHILSTMSEYLTRRNILLRKYALGTGN